MVDIKRYNNKNIGQFLSIPFSLANNDHLLDSVYLSLHLKKLQRKTVAAVRESKHYVSTLAAWQKKLAGADASDLATVAKTLGFNVEVFNPLASSEPRTLVTGGGRSSKRKAQLLKVKKGVYKPMKAGAIIDELPPDMMRDVVGRLEPRDRSSLSKVSRGVREDTLAALPPQTKLWRAVYTRNIELLQTALEEGADVNAKDKIGSTPLQMSAEHGHLEVVRALIEARAEVNAKTNCGWFTLHWSAAKGHLEVVRALIEAGADVNVKADDGWTPLHMSASNQLLDIARYLIEKGADVNAKRKYDGKTPLHISAERGQLEVVRVLIDAGADVNAKNNNGETPLHESLHASAIYGDEEIARALIEAGADVNDRASNGESALHVSANKGHLEFARVLIDNGAELNIKKVPGSNWHCGFTPLHFCASNGHLEFARALIEAGADVNAKDLNTENWTPLHESIKYGHLEVARALIEAGADVDAKTTDCSLDDVDFGVGHSTPLHFCAGKGKFISVKFLLMNGASLHHKNADGFTQLDCLKSNFDAVTLTNLFSQMEKKWLVNWILSLGN